MVESIAEAPGEVCTVSYIGPWSHTKAALSVAHSAPARSARRSFLDGAFSIASVHLDLVAKITLASKLEA